MQTMTHDIIINGAGPTGSTLALMLAKKSRHPERIALVGQAARRDANSLASGPATPDPRTLALNYGSRVLLEQLQAWPETFADIHTVHVSQRGRLGRTLIDRRDLDVPYLGSVVSYHGLLTSLHVTLRASGVDLIEQATTPISLSDRHVVCDVPEKTLRAPVAVQSDGRQPHGLQRHYHQDALLATVQATLPAQNWAYERFTRQGPLALLPHPENTGIFAVVWCCPPDHAHYLKTLDRSAFDAALHDHFGDRLGQLHCLGDRHVFPLSSHVGPSLINQRIVAIGNAAQTLHPVAGQGLNLGLRDVAQLALTLAPWLAQPRADATPFLRRFTQRRHPDRWFTAGITDFLPRVFATGNPLIEHGGGLALLGLDLIPSARHALARHLLQGMRT